VRFALDGSDTNEIQFPSIAPGTSHWEEWQHAPLNAGEHTFSVLLDVFNQVSEGAKDDNTQALPFYVAEAELPVLQSDVVLAAGQQPDDEALALNSDDAGENHALDLDLANLLEPTIAEPLSTQIGTAILVTVYFGHNDFVLDTRNLAAVEALGERIHFMVNPEITVDGYASGEGNAAENMQLSEMRRQAVMALLRRANDGAQFAGVAHGESDLAEPETGKGAELEAQRARNRRVTIFVTGLAEPPKPKGPDLDPPQPIPTEQEMMEERLNRAVKQPSQWPNPGGDRSSVINKLWEKVDEAVEQVTKKFTDNKKIRDAIKDGVHKATEKGAEELFDRAVDQTSLGNDAKEGIKNGIKAVLELKPK
jgi:outer membrane protein OmpA-like peptidoglycan-associated protein